MHTLTGNTTVTPTFDSDSLAAINIKVPGARASMQAVAGFDQNLGPPPGGSPCIAMAQVVADDLVQVTLFWWGGAAPPVLTDLYVTVRVFHGD